MIVSCQVIIVASHDRDSTRRQTLFPLCLISRVLKTSFITDRPVLFALPSLEQGPAQLQWVHSARTSRSNHNKEALSRYYCSTLYGDFYITWDCPRHEISNLVLTDFHDQSSLLWTLDCSQISSCDAVNQNSPAPANSLVLSV